MEAKASNDSIIRTGDTVLVRESDTRTWFVSLFSYKIRDNYFICANGSTWAQCIPLKDNEHLCGTNKDFTKPFEFRFGAKVKAQLRGETITGILIGCRNKEKWYDFDDETVSEINTSRLVTNNAYLLFYKLK